jgi:hypothetical protein
VGLRLDMDAAAKRKSTLPMETEPIFSGIAVHSPVNTLSELPTHKNKKAYAKYTMEQHEIFKYISFSPCQAVTASIHYTQYVQQFLLRRL